MTPTTPHLPDRGPRAARAQRLGRGSHRGVVIMMVTIAMLALLVFVATAIDVGAARAERTNTQSSADLAVLAALNVMARGGTQDDASLAAKRIVEQNLGIAVNDPLWSGCQDAKSLEAAGGVLSPSDTAIGNHCISFKTGTPPVARVRVPTRAVPTVFAKVIGIASIDVTASAGADGDPNSCDLLDPTCVEIATTTTTTTEWTWEAYCQTLDPATLYIWNWDPSACKGKVPGTDDTTRATYLTTWCGQLVLDGSFSNLYLYYWQACDPFVGLGPTDRANWLNAECTVGQIEWIIGDWWFQMACREVKGDSTIDAWIDGWYATSSSTSPPSTDTTTTAAPTTTAYDPLRLNY